MSAARVLLWRHGRTAYNAERRFQGQIDVPLDDVGRAQAAAAAPVLAARIRALTSVDAPSSVRIVTSDLSRAWMTADALAAILGVPAEHDQDLREIAAGAWEGLLRREIAERWPHELRAWQAGEDVAVGGKERRSRAGERTASAIRRYADDLAGGVLVVVSHGGCLRAALPLLLGLGQGHEPFGVLGNAHWADVMIGARGWQLSGYNLGVAAEVDGSVAAPAATVLDEPVPSVTGRSSRGAPGTDVELAGVTTTDSVGREGEIV